METKKLHIGDFFLNTFRFLYSDNESETGSRIICQYLIFIFVKYNTNNDDGIVILYVSDSIPAMCIMMIELNNEVY